MVAGLQEIGFEETGAGTDMEIVAAWAKRVGFGLVSEPVSEGESEAT